jgi:predicted ATPase
VLVGRREELRQIGGLLAAVKRGRSGALVLVGEPGIGKSALLEETVRRARGVRILRASGVESESELPYAGLLTLTRPVAELVPSLPEPQAQALTAALALGPAPPADPLAVCAATLGLLAAAAEHEPVLAVVDERQRFHNALAWFTKTVRESTNTDPSVEALTAGGPARVPSQDERRVDAGAPEPNPR